MNFKTSSSPPPSCLPHMLVNVEVQTDLVVIDFPVALLLPHFQVTQLFSRDIKTIEANNKIYSAVQNT